MNEERWNKGGLSYFYRNFLWQWQDSNKLLWVYATKWFSNNTSDNVRHSAVKYLYAEGFCRVLLRSSSKRNVPKSTFINSRKIINNETVSQSNQQFWWYIFSIILRSFSVRSPFVLRSFSVRRSKNDRRNIGESSEARRRCIETLMGNQGKGDPNKNFFWPHYFLYAQYTTLVQANSR